MNSKLGNAIATGALLISMFVAGAAVAGTPDDVRTETVKFQDLNLKTEAGVDALYQRIHKAARRVCWQSSDAGLSSAYAIQRCEEKAENRAIMDVNSPELSAFYQKKTGRPVPMLAKSQ
jgi:UrcA family protein